MTLMSDKSVQLRSMEIILQEFLVPAALVVQWIYEGLIISFLARKVKIKILLEVNHS